MVIFCLPKHIVNLPDRCAYTTEDPSRTRKAEFMFLGACLFALVFILIAPPARAFLFAHLTGGAEWLKAWAPFSFILLAILIVAPLVAFYIMRTWPVHVEPENPMAKYRRDPLDEIE